MKFLLRYIIILCCFFAFSLYVDHSILSFSNQLKETSSALDQAVYNKEWNAAEKSLDLITIKWENKKKIWLLLLDHENIDEIDRSLAEVKQMIRIQQYDMALHAISTLHHCLEDIPQSQTISLSNIF